MMKKFFHSKKVEPTREEKHAKRKDGKGAGRSKSVTYNASADKQSEASQEEDRLREEARRELLNQLKQAEEEAHRRDKSIEDFEHILKKQSYCNRVATTAGKSNKEAETEREASRKKRTSLKTKVAKYLVQATAWWDLIMILVTLFHIRSVRIALENVFRENYYDYCSDFQPHGPHIFWVQVIHGLASLALLCSFSKAMADLMLLWLASKVGILMFIGYRESHGIRLLTHSQASTPKNFGVVIGIVIFYCVQIIAVIILYFDYKKPYNQRRLQLQSSRPLNRDIYLKSLPPFMQRKYAVRWAEKLQALYVLQRIQERDRQRATKKGVEDPDLDVTDEELAKRVAHGIKEFQRTHDFNFGETLAAASFTTRKTHPYYKRVNRKPGKSGNNSE